MNDKTLQSLVEAMATAGKQKTSPYDTEATVSRVDADGTAWVRIPGGEDDTPCKLTINAKKGDVVQVRVSGGRAFMVGNSSAPPTDDTRANEAASQAVQAMDYSSVAKKAADSALEAAGTAAMAAAEAVETAEAVSGIAQQARTDAAAAQTAATEAGQAATAAQNSLKSVVQGATTVEKAVSVMQTALEAVVDYDPNTDTTKEYFWHDAAGAHVLGDDSGYRNDIDSSGMKIVDVNTEKSVADFSADGIELSMPSSSDTANDINYMSVKKGTTGTVSRQSTGVTVLGGTAMNIRLSAGLQKSGVTYPLDPSSTYVYVNGEAQTGSGSEDYTGDVLVTMNVTSVGAMVKAFLTEPGTYTYYNGAIEVTYSLDDRLLTITNYGAWPFTCYVEYTYTETHAKYRFGTQLVAEYDAQTVVGKYNDNADNAFEVGNGSDEDNRSNAFAVDWNGNVDAAGDVTDGSGNVLADKADASDVKEIIVESVALSSTTLTANGGTGSATGSVARTGYTPLGIVGVQKSGSGNGQVAITAFMLSGSNATVSLFNEANAQRVVGTTVYILYKAS